jgi:cell wall-associated NlpC family hydrolase
MNVIRRITVAMLLCCVGLAAYPSSTAAFGERELIEEALEEYERFFTPVLSAMTDLRLANESSSEKTERLAQSEELLQETEAALRSDRTRFSGIVVSAYMDRGSRSNGSLRSAETNVALISARLRAAERSHDDALKAVAAASSDLRRADERLQNALDAVTDAEEKLSESADVLHRFVTTQVPTLPGYAYASYMRASKQILLEDPSCRIPPALFVGLGRMMSNHGEPDVSAMTPSGRSIEMLRGLVGAPVPDTDLGLLDGNAEADVRIGPMQLLPAHWSEFHHSETVAALTPNWIYASSVATGAMLCSATDDLTTDSGIHRALVSFTGNPSLARAVMGIARHATRATDLQLGELPADPRQHTAIERLALTEPIDVTGAAPIDVLLAWSRTRLGTPYSQCLGVDVRPEDPECPPGTNRFGQGFFDCSGFVSAAYGALGFELPTTTDAMLRSDEFAHYFTRDHYEADDDRAGDILLMDGHVALSAGGGVVIHASGGQLVEEPLPSWVKRGVLGVYRLLVGN